jgi:hypothetical protein
LDGIETEVFHPLHDICKTIGRITIPDRCANFELVYKPNARTGSEIDGSGHRADAYIRPLDRSVVVSDVTDDHQSITGDHRPLTAEQSVVFELKTSEHWEKVKDVSNISWLT